MLGPCSERLAGSGDRDEVVATCPCLLAEFDLLGIAAEVGVER